MIEAGADGVPRVCWRVRDVWEGTRQEILLDAKIS